MTYVDFLNLPDPILLIAGLLIGCGSGLTLSGLLQGNLYDVSPLAWLLIFLGGFILFIYGVFMLNPNALINGLVLCGVLWFAVLRDKEASK